MAQMLLLSGRRLVDKAGARSTCARIIAEQLASQSLVSATKSAALIQLVDDEMIWTFALLAILLDLGHLSRMLLNSRIEKTLTLTIIVVVTSRRRSSCSTSMIEQMLNVTIIGLGMGTKTSFYALLLLEHILATAFAEALADEVVVLLARVAHGRVHLRRIVRESCR